MAVARRPKLLYVALALFALVSIDVLRASRLPPRLDTCVWILWPWISASLSWWVWRGGYAALLTGAVYACCVAYAPLAWSNYPTLFGVVSLSMYKVSPLVSVVAWATASTTSRYKTSEHVAAVLALSGFLDITVGALSPAAPWAVAAKLSWATWAAVAALLLRDLRAR